MRSRLRLLFGSITLTRSKAGSKTNKSSTTLDSCYGAVLSRYTDTLKALGYDPASSTGKNKLLSEIRIYQCRELYALMQKEWADEEAKKMLFKGEFVSQAKLATGEYEIVLCSSTTKEKKIFKDELYLKENGEVISGGAVPLQIRNNQYR